MSISLAREIGAVTHLAVEFARRGDVSPAERLAFHRRKAELLTVIAEKDGGAESREVASAAWRQVREWEVAR